MRKAAPTTPISTGFLGEIKKPRPVPSVDSSSPLQPPPFMSGPLLKALEGKVPKSAIRRPPPAKKFRADLKRAQAVGETKALGKDSEWKAPQRSVVIALKNKSSETAGRGAGLPAVPVNRSKALTSSEQQWFGRVWGAGGFGRSTKKMPMPHVRKQDLGKDEAFAYISALEYMDGTREPFVVLNTRYMPRGGSSTLSSRRDQAILLQTILHELAHERQRGVFDGSVPREQIEGGAELWSEAADNYAAKRLGIPATDLAYGDRLPVYEPEKKAFISANADYLGPQGLPILKYATPTRDRWQFREDQAPNYRTGSPRDRPKSRLSPVAWPAVPFSYGYRAERAR